LGGKRTHLGVEGGGRNADVRVGPDKDDMFAQTPGEVQKKTVRAAV